MGRWAQRRRTGGGGQSHLVQMVLADLQADPHFVLVTWSGPVLATWFATNAFIETENSSDSVAITQSSTNALLIEFADTTASDASVSVSSQTGQAAAPDSIVITP